MSVFKTYSLESLSEFSNRSEKLAIFERDPVKGADEFFQKVMINEFKIKGQVFRKNSYNHITNLIESVVPKKVTSKPFYSIWLKDMSNMCKYFCDFLKIESVGFSLGTKRVCKRYHVDNVPMRLLVTYAGKGTEWLPDKFVDRNAYENGLPNESILKNPSRSKFINTWDVAIFRGGSDGLLHRSPDAALNGTSIMMRLDHEYFWNEVMKHDFR